MHEQLRCNEAGLALIKHSEGLYLKAYRCPAGIWTIGYGHTSAAGAPEVYPGKVITEEEADAILRSDLSEFEGYVRQYVKVALDENQFSALVSFVFNVGPGNFKKSTLLKVLNKGQYDAVPEQLLRWNRAGGKVMKGLVLRRHAEAALWDGLSGDQPITQHCVQVPQKVDAPKIRMHPALPASGGAGAAALVPALAKSSTILSDPRLLMVAGYVFIGLGIFVLGVIAGSVITKRKGTP